MTYEKDEQKAELAPPGGVWVCGACGKTAHDRYRFNDVSCFLHAVLCAEDSLVVEAGRVTHAEALTFPAAE